MSKEDNDQVFAVQVRDYVVYLLHGICVDRFDIALQLPQARKTIRLVARLSDRDYEAFDYSDLYKGVREVVRRCGKIRIDSQGDPYITEFKLYDRSFEQLEFVEAQPTSELARPGREPGTPA